MTDSVGRGTLLASRFRLEDLLGEARGAHFWRATDLTLARNAAIHVIGADDPRADNLLQAARLSANVTESRLLRVLDAAREDGVVYVVSEWGSGSSLDRLLAEDVLPPRRAAWVAREVAEAIAHTHRQGVAHGRLIPENVMVTEAGSVKLIGFAVDAVLHAPPSDEWAPPGQAEDVTDLGALLYAALVGRWPGALASRVPPAPRAHGRVLRARQVRAGVPRSLDLLCDEVLNPTDHAAEQPADRPGEQGGARVPASAAQVAARLGDFLGDVAGAPALGPAPGSGEGEETTVLGPVRASGRDVPAELDPDATQAAAPVFDDTGQDDTGQDRPDPAQRPRQPPAPGLGAARPPARSTGGPGGHARHRAPSADRSPRAPQSPPTGPPAGQHASPPSPGPRPAPEPAPHGAPGFTGMGAGGLPPAWGPDRPDDVETATGDQPAAPPWEKKRPGRTWLRLAVVVASALLLAVAVVVAFRLGRDTVGQGGDAPSGARGQAVRVEAATDFDPLADPPEENPATAKLAVDGDPSTAWETVTYRNRPDLGGLKDGVGLLLDLGEDVGVSQVRLTLGGAPYDVSLLAAAEGTRSAPSDLDGLTEVDQASGVGPAAQLGADQPVTTRFLVVWLTSLPAADGGFQGRVAEIVVRS